jgi:hypothetical protein
MRKKFASSMVVLILVIVLINIDYSPNNNSSDSPSLIDPINNGSNNEIRSMEPGDTRAFPGWLDEVRVANVTNEFHGWDMVVWGNYVHIVWRDSDSGGNDSIYYKRSTNNGLNWGNDILLYNSNYNHGPRIGIFENHVHIIWVSDDDSISYINSSDNGETWSDIIGWDWTTYPQASFMDSFEGPDIAVKDNNVYIVTNCMGAGHIISRRSSDNGSTWANWTQLGDFAFPWPTLSIDVTNNILHVTGYYLSPMSSQWIDHFFSDDNGDTWYENIWNPVVSVQTIEKVITYATVSTEADMYRLYYSLMDGVNNNIGTFVNYSFDSDPEIWFGPTQVITNGEGHFDVDKFHIVWGEKDGDNLRQLHSNITGQITDFSSNSTWPVININGGTIHVIWQDDRNSSIELYYSNRELVPSPPSSPSNQTAGLSPVDLSDIIINWDSSSDDGFGDNDVAGYTVYKSLTGVDGSYEFAAWIEATGSPSYSWTDFGAGDGDPNNYFYIVRANDTLNNEEQNEIKIGKVAIQFNDGWNMLSNPLIQSDISKEAVLQTLTGNYSSLQGYHAGKSLPWIHWNKDKPDSFNDEIEIFLEYGYFVKMDNPDSLVFAGAVPTSVQVSLTSGWNLIGYPSLTNHNRTAGLNNLLFDSDINAIQWFDSTTKTWHDLGLGDSFEIGRGYWFHAKSDCVWEVPL